MPLPEVINAAARRITEPGEVAAALREGIESRAPNLIEAVVDDGYTK